MRYCSYGRSVFNSFCRPRGLSTTRHTTMWEPLLTPALPGAAPVSLCPHPAPCWHTPFILAHSPHPCHCAMHLGRG